MMQNDQSLDSHIRAVNEWLEANVRVYPEPTQIILRQIQMDPVTLKGSALLFLGNDDQSESLELQMAENGWLTFCIPLFHSPLGAPASYGAIKMTNDTEGAVSAAVRSLLPRLMPFGINPKTKKWITTSTPLQERILDKGELMAALDRIGQPDFECRQLVVSNGLLA
jgi:hypothetical protein